MYESHICRHFWPSLRRLCFSKLKQSHFCSNFSDALLVQTGLYSWYFCATVSTVSSGWKFEGVSATSRRFFVTFKGKFYMERGSYIQDCHFCSFKKLNLHRLSLTQCHIHPKDKKKKLPTFAKEKQQLQLQQLMNTTFALVPEGSQPASYRRAEAVSAGCIPVFNASDGYVRSFEHDIDWNSISISFEDMVIWSSSGNKKTYFRGSTFF